MTRSKKALIVWELGAGRGHLEHILPIALSLLQGNWSVVVAARDTVLAKQMLSTIDPNLRASNLALAQAPIFLHKAEPQGLANSLSEILFKSGFGNESYVYDVVRTWRSLIDAVKPDVIIADFAPSAVAANSKKIPVIVVGNCWTIPPHISPLPSLGYGFADNAKACNVERDLLTTFDKACLQKGVFATFSELLRGDAQFIFSSRFTDPYQRYRSDSYFFPPNIGHAGPQEKNLYDVVVYLPGRHRAIDLVANAINHLELNAVAYFGGASLVKPSKVVVSRTPLNLSELIPFARLVIHHGGLGLANWSLIHGKRQVVIPNDAEKMLNGIGLRNAGFADIVRGDEECDDLIKILRSSIHIGSYRPPSDLFSTRSSEETLNCIADLCSK